MFDYIIYTDGGCASNPGGRGGYGAVIINCSTGEITELSEGFIASTNNRMEIMAAIKALEKINTDKGKKYAVQLFSDSQYFINTAAGLWHGKKNPDLWQRYREVSNNVEIQFKWVRGHNGTKYNEHCDELATLAMQGSRFSVDEGFRSEALHNPGSDGAETLHYSNAMERKITADFPENNITIEEMEQRGVKAECARMIDSIVKKKQPSFKDFLDLKTFGRDKISGMNVQRLVDISGDGAWKQIQEHFPENSANALSALRWHVRGLPVSYAIRKEMVNQEVSRNAINSKYRR